MNNSLYQLTESFITVLDNIPEDVDQQTINDTLEAIDGAIEEKAYNIVAYSKWLDSQAKGIAAEEKRLADRRKAFENRSKSIKTYLQGNMERIGKTKIEHELFTISLQDNPGAVQINDDKVIPAKYLTIIPESYVPDKKAIAAAIKAGEIVPGCEFVQGRRLAVR